MLKPLLLVAPIAAALVTAPTADAGCISVNGRNNTSGCTSVQGSTAVAFGQGATATADAPRTLAVAVGTNAKATATSGKWNTSISLGDRTETLTSEGDRNLAVAVGPDNYAQAGYPTDITIPANNRAVVVGKSANATAIWGNQLTAITLGGLSATEAGDASGPTNPNARTSSRVTATTIGLGSTNQAIGNKLRSRAAGNGITQTSTNP